MRTVLLATLLATLGLLCLHDTAQAACWRRADGTCTVDEVSTVPARHIWPSAPYGCRVPQWSPVSVVKELCGQNTRSPQLRQQRQSRFVSARTLHPDAPFECRLPDTTPPDMVLNICGRR